MMPLVYDLLQTNGNNRVDQVQAIFLYPLNALMEDQKERLEKLLEGTELHYAVYNGDLPEREYGKEERDYEKVRRKIDSIKGIERDDKGNVIKIKFKHAIATRKELRETPANILLTNPTMLEYILLRGKDSSLIAPELKSLRWMVLDETHTYTGAGAAEIAMLLRRVLMAFNVQAKDVRFATSSATIGNGGEEDEKALKRFIADITGLTMPDIEVVKGTRKDIEDLPDDEYRSTWLRLLKDNTDGYISLDKLVEGPQSIAEKLAFLDDMCTKAEGEGMEDLRMKVHYFYRVPNSGLYVDIAQYSDGSFKIYTENKETQEGETPRLELSRCKHCGEYVAIAEADFKEHTFKPLSFEDYDMFEMVDEVQSKKHFLIFATSKEEPLPKESNVPYIIAGNHFTPMTSGNFRNWHVIGNVECKCPYCGKKLTKETTVDDDGLEIVSTEEEDAKKLRKFRVAADFISRLIAPSTLNQMTEVSGSHLHRGQQYIGFVDSRQMAARATIKQNLEEERYWVYSTIFHALNQRKQEQSETLKQIEELNCEYDDRHTSRERKREIDRQIMSLEDSIKNYFTWAELVELLKKDPNMLVYCNQFAERSEQSKELDKEGNLRPRTIDRYVQSILVQYLSSRPLSAAAPETMGLFTSYFEKLEPALENELPDEVKAFNKEVGNEFSLSKQDWHDLMHTFLDYTVRSNQSVYLKMSDTDEMDIFKCVRFATQKERRRPVRKPEIKEKTANMSRVIRLLANLISKSHHIAITDAIRVYADLIQSVIDAMWADLTQTYEIITRSTHYDSETEHHEYDKDEEVDGVFYPQYRLNLADLGFRLYENVWLCDTNTSADSESRHVKCLRPIGYSFKGVSPYLISGVPVPLSSNMHEIWPVFNLPLGTPLKEIHEWAAVNRRLLWDNGLWNDNGDFADHLDVIYHFPDLFVQAEHTAQVDKMISRKVQKDFKAHDINILACSTTMEMGVDLGDLELVLMNSVPPMPSNYKQRAGRSGRRGQPRSAAVTLCGSDVVGLRTLKNPMDNIILRPINSPTVDLESAQVVQRHANSFLIREFGVFNMSDHGGSIMQHVVDYYTPFKIERRSDSNQIDVKRKDNNHLVSPSDGLGDPTGTSYESFNEACAKPLTPELKRKLDRLLDGTIFSGKSEYVKDQARLSNERCYAELEDRIRDLGDLYDRAKSQKQQAFFMMKYIEPLNQQLLTYWATHRFTPNANMPVNIIEFDINSSSSSHYQTVKPSNPSYPLRTALAQYVPGNPIARDGMVRIVRGVRYSNFFSTEKTFKSLYYNQEQVAIDDKELLPDLQKWNVSQSTELMLIQPTEFIPDMNESANRILDKNEYTRVNAQLIGTEDWAQEATEPHLFDARNNRESGNAKILYYNEGVGFGFCHCVKCGRTVLEHWAAATASNPRLLPAEMNQVEAKEEGKPKYHYSLVKRGNQPSRCIGCNSQEHIKRNVVLGDMIQTDYSEIRIRHLHEGWIKNRKANLELLTTLGVLFTQALAEILNIERSDIDFTITPNAHICVFDVNPGGSGYANQLSEMDLLKKVIRRAKAILENAKGDKEAIIDRNTLYSVNNLNLQLAKDWIDEELSAQIKLPASVKALFPEATEASLLKMERAFATAQRDAVIFFDDTYSEWDYDTPDSGWKGPFFNHFASRGMTQVCIIKNKPGKMPEPILSMLRGIDGWATEVTEMENPFGDIYPLAYIDGRLYFTNNPDHISLNNRWGSCTIYYSQCRNISLDATPVDLSVNPATTKIFRLEPSVYPEINSTDLGKIIVENGGTIISDFLTYCEESEEPIKVSYQDEHLKSPMGIILTLQTIEYLMRKIGRDFSIEFLLERYDDESTRTGFAANLANSRLRDDYLKNMVKLWIDKLDNTTHNMLHGTMLPIVSQSKGSLTHWRELTVECGDKKLSIYPDGGFINGWSLDKDRTTHFIRKEEADTDEIVPLALSQAVKYDITVEDR